MLEDAHWLVVRFFEPINESPGQIYISALTFAPRCSLVEVYGDEGGSNFMVSPQDQMWGICLSVVYCNYGHAQFSRDGRYLLSSSLWSTGYEIAIRDATTGNPLTIARREKTVISVDIHPNNRYVISLLRDGTVEEWDWTSDVHSRSMYAWAEEDKNRSTSDGGQVAYNDDGSRIDCHWDGSNTISVWSTDDQTRPMQRISLPSGSSCTKFSFDSDMTSIIALLSSADEWVVVKRWSIETGDELSPLQIAMDKVKRAEFVKTTICSLQDTSGRFACSSWKTILGLFHQQSTPIGEHLMLPNMAISLPLHISRISIYGMRNQVRNWPSTKDAII